jgi:hypothetical protein
MTVARTGSALTTLLVSFLSAAALAHPGGHGGGAHFSGGGHAGGGAHFSGGSRAAAAPRSFAGTAGRTASPATRTVVRPAVYQGAGHALLRTAPAVAGHPGSGSYGGRDRRWGAGYGHPVHWGGGYWGGRYWPGVYYGAGFAWFLPSIPLYCATFWWLGIPYYYYNDVYYTWSPAASGYVATDPPPMVSEAAPAATDVAAVGDGSEPPPGAAAAADGPAGQEQPIAPGRFALSQPAGGGFQDHVFAYPANGQSDQQQQQDRAACDQWAAAQAGSAGGEDFHRAVIACFEGRGYSAR